MGRKNGFFILAVMFALVGFNARAADVGSQFGVMYGLSVPDAPNTNPYMMIGIKGSAMLAPWFSTGGYFLNTDNQGAQSATEKFRYSLAGVDATYHMPTGTGDSYFGFRMGITKVKTNPNLIDETFSPYHYGIATGYDFHVLSWAVIGFEGSYLHVLPGKVIQNGNEIFQDSFNIMSFLVTFQIHI